MDRNHGGIEKWRHWQSAAEGLSDRTITERCDRLYDFAHAIDGDPSGASLDDVLLYLADLRSRERWGRPIKASSIATYYGQLRAWFAWLVITDQRDDNPTAKIKGPRVPRGKPRPVSDLEFSAVFTTRVHRRTSGMMLLAAYHGLRAGEVAHFHGRWINLVADELHVIGKGGVEQDLPLHPVIRALAETYPRNDYWFPSNCVSSHLHVTPNSVSGIVGDVFRRAGVDGGIHRLRHWYATKLVEKEVNLRVVQELLRHASLQTTQVYTQVTLEQQRQAIRLLEAPRPLPGHLFAA